MSQAFKRITAAMLMLTEAMMLQQRPVSRTALIWLMVLQLAVLAPLAINLPAWLIVLSLSCWGWRLALLNGRVSPPGKWFSGLAVVVCVALVVLLEGRLLHLKGFALLLAFGFIFKLIELKNLRDAFLVLVLAVMLLAVNLLLSQTLVVSILSAISFFVLLCCWIGLNHIGAEVQWRQPMRLAAQLYVMAAPIAIALFLLVPRIPPFWQVSLNTGQAQTGLSDRMSPGDISQLVRSDELAFRVSFNQERPPQQALYWRAVVMTEFDGRSWQQANQQWFGRNPVANPAWPKPLDPKATPWVSWQGQPKPWAEQSSGAPQYSVILEASQQHWLPALAMPTSADPNIGLVADQRLVHRRPVLQRIQYEVSSRATPLDKHAEQAIVSEHRTSYLDYPKDLNPQIQQYAAALWQQQPRVNAFVQSLMRYVRQHDYAYTLSPPLAGLNAVDEFWFQHKAGFCAHYASAFALMLRVVGIPSRVVGGYQGGEWDEQANYLQVRQYDAHAWVEYWQPDAGWIRLDPTAAIAPERIESSFVQSLRMQQFEHSNALSSWRFSGSEWLLSWRQRWDRLEYLWHRNVLNYKQQQQLELLKRWFGDFDWRQMLVGLVIAISGFLTIIALWQSKPWRRPKVDPQVALFTDFCRKLKKLGVEVDEGLSPNAILTQLDDIPAQKQTRIRSWIAQFVALRFEPNTPPQHYRELKKRLKQI
ncbi:transglutaminaseTgpA domain-containing protein [Neiella marina]|uniref:TransglutaminaseTgpA domain-containing protein n=1 Tax=Neiella holothuriorum TaxID=2870530 RepID=A0ABS7EE23_9GAMM|nr:transglutaminaseTgpA domain-containing protein [Neiella holothuriorum]MBW8190594.1 transglutaminaseTgpA domain-containing protein [Neiella holothuriorum]